VKLAQRVPLELLAQRAALETQDPLGMMVFLVLRDAPAQPVTVATKATQAMTVGMAAPE
jgi:hypothetical protein